MSGMGTVYEMERAKANGWDAESLRKVIARLEEDLLRQKERTQYEAEQYGNALNERDEAMVRAAKIQDSADDLAYALERCVEVIEFAYMNAPKQPKEIAAARAAIVRAKGAK